MTIAATARPLAKRVGNGSQIQEWDDDAMVTPTQTRQYVDQQTQNSYTDWQNSLKAYENAVNNGDPNANTTLFDDMTKKAGTFEYWLQEELRVDETSGGQSAIDSDISKINAGFGGDDYGRGILQKITGSATSTVQGESIPQRSVEIDLVNVQFATQEMQTALQNHKDGTQAQQDYVQSLQTLHDDLVKELNLPANYTDQQLSDALAKLKADHKGEGLDDLIDGLGPELKVAGNLSKIDPKDPNLAHTDPVSLAFIKSAGVSLDPKDYNTTDPKASNYLSQQELDLMKNDPMTFALMRLAHISIRPATNNTGVQVLINGKPAQGLTTDQLNLALGNQVKPLVTSLLQQTKWSPDIQKLMQGTDVVRLDYTTKQMKTMMSGPHPDIQKALQFLTTNLDAMFSQDSRAALWQQAGLPYFNKQWVSNQIDQLVRKPNVNDPDFWKETQDATVYADKVGQWMQQVLKNAPAELANIILDTVKSKFNKNWYYSNQIANGGVPRMEDFYKGLSMAVELAPDRAKDIAGWLTSQSGPQSGVLPELHGSGMGIGYEAIRDTVANGYGATLSQTLMDLLNADKKRSPDLNYEFNLMLTQGMQKMSDNYTLKINRQLYNNFISDPGTVLNPFFSHFLADPYIGTAQHITSDTQLRDLIGTALGLTPSDQAAAKAGDFSKEWYKPGTADWNIITLVTDWIHGEGGKTPTVTALPLVYASPRAGIHNGALFQITKADGSTETIDGSAAIDAVQTSQTGKVDPNNVNFQWHYSDFTNFEQKNQYDDNGGIYLYSDFLKDPQHTTNPQRIDWSKYRHAAHITTWEDRVKEGLGIVAMTTAAVGGVLLAIPTGGTSLAITGMVLVGVGTAGSIALSADHLYEMGSHGESTSWSNPDAQQQWLNIIGSSAALVTLGSGAAIRWAGLSTKVLPWVAGISKVSGFASTGIGFEQTSGQVANLLQNWDQMSDQQRIESLAMLGVGIGQFAVGGLKFEPTAASTLPTPSSDAVTSDYAYQLHLDDPTRGANDNWFQSEQDIRKFISMRARDLWRAAGRPSGQDDTFWLQAEQEILQNGGRPMLPTLTSSVSRDEFVLNNAYELHLDDPGRSPQANYFQALQELSDITSARARDLWRAAGRPSGQDATFWAQAEDSIFNPPDRPTLIQLLKGKATGVKDNFMDDWNSRRSKTNAGYGVRWRSYWDQAKTYAKFSAIAYLGINGAGVIGALGYYFGLQTQRKTSASPVTARNAYSELLKLQANTDAYMKQNYDNDTFFGLPIENMPVAGKIPFNADGHLLEITPGTSPFYNFTKDPYYFRRVPQDLYEALLHSNDPNVSHSHTYTDKYGKKTTLNGVFVTERIKDASGKWVDITVEIRPPYSSEPFRDAGISQFFSDPGLDGTPGKGIFGLPGFRWRPQLAIGPIEGMRFHADLEVLFDDRYSTPTATTIRLGAPSLTQGWGIGVRQQNTSLWSRFNFSVNAVDINAAKTLDLTDPSSPFSGTEWELMNGRFYLDVGNRDRVRFDFSGKGDGSAASWDPNKLYLRNRETTFAELGFGADFLRFAFANGSSLSLNGYYELQFYPNDYRSQLNFMDGGSGTITRSVGFQDFPPLFEIDPALQLTAAGNVPWFGLGHIPRFVPPVPALTAPSP
jgi:hypothetical protein